MEKKYIEPETLVVTINLSNILMLSPGNSQEGEQTLSNFGNEMGDDHQPDPGDFDDGEFARKNNGGNIWDNIW